MADPIAAQPAATPSVAVTAASNAVYRDGGALTWDELFPPGAETPGSQGATTPQGGNQPTQTPAATQTAAQTNAAAFELKTKTGTVYKSAEDAIKGIEHKDALIEQLRQRYILERGIDPVTGQQVQLQSTAQTVNYMQDRKRYVEDLTQAAQKNDSDAIWQAQTKLVSDMLAPLAPVMSSFAKQQAIETLSGEIKDIREFVGGDDYKKALEDTPDLRDAIARAENDYQHHQRLSGLYKVAYRVSQGIRLPEILRAQPQQANAQPVRTTTATQTLPPPQQSSTQAALHGTREQRKELIARFEAQGAADRPLV